MAKFDPYRKWLGIPPQEQPPNHYRLLGIGLFESDPDVIANAADRQMAHVRTFQSGKHSAVSQQVLNELASARVCLLDPAKRQAYDQWLRQIVAMQQLSAAPMAPGPPPPPAPPPPAPPSPADQPFEAVLSSQILAPRLPPGLEGFGGGGEIGLGVPQEGGLASFPPQDAGPPPPPPRGTPAPAVSIGGGVTTGAVAARRKKQSAWQGPGIALAVVGGLGLLLLIALVVGFSGSGRSKKPGGSGIKRSSTGIDHRDDRYQPSKRYPTRSDFPSPRQPLSADQGVRSPSVVPSAPQCPGKPESVKPDTGKPDSSKPDGAKPDTAKPDGVKLADPTAKGTTTSGTAAVGIQAKTAQPAGKDPAGKELPGKEPAGKEPAGKELAKSNVPNGNDPEDKADASKTSATNGAEAGNTAEAALARALDWLDKHQNPDGSWSFNHRGPKCKDKCPNPGTLAKAPNGATALALMAFLGSGNGPREGKHRKLVFAGLNYLKSSVPRLGAAINLSDDQAPQTASHAMATVVLCEASARKGGKPWRPYAEAAVQFLITTQNSDGGWGWRPKSDSEAADPSSIPPTEWDIAALKAAQRAGIDVPERVFQQAGIFLEQLLTRDQSGYRRELKSNDRDPLATAAAMLSHLYLGWPRDKQELLSYAAVVGKGSPATDGQFYLNFCNTQVLREVGGPDWNTWSAAMREHLLGAQAKEGHAAGSWFIQTTDSAEGGRLYCTALGALILEVDSRTQPLLRKG